ncbi:MAG: hypothetical protein M1299_12180 [Firmicutes bacterium]|nr:hypothetical protein [Bacillota bacterium]
MTGSSIFMALRIPITVTEKNHAKVSGIAKGPNTDASAAFRFWLQDKS